MRKFLKACFHIPKHGNIGERVMLARTVATVCIILVCLAAMSLTAYAYFSSDTTALVHAIQAADFDVEVTVSQNGVTVTPAAGVYTLSDGVYTVTLKKAGRATTGFCLVERVDTAAVYHTEQLGKSGESTVNEISFTLNVSNTVPVTFTPHWGTSRYYGYANGDEEAVIRNGETKTIVGAGNAASVSEPTGESTTVPTATQTSAAPTASSEPELSLPTTTASTTLSAATTATSASSAAETTAGTTVTEGTSEETTEPSETATEPTAEPTEATGATEEIEG